MKLGRVIGRVVCTTKLPCFEGLTLLLVQPLDEALAEAGNPLVAWDTAKAGEGDLVLYEGGKEAAQANPNGWYNPGDAAILGVVDVVDAVDAVDAISAAGASSAKGAGEGARA